MPRQRGGGARPSRPAAAPSRPVPAPARPNVAPPQQRSASTAAHPPATQQAPQQAGRSPGLFGQMASTAAGVAVGSSIGHAIGGFFGGSSTAADQGPVDSALQSNSSYQDNGLARSCENDAKAFTKCLDENKGEHAMSVCGWYLENLKACQQAASQY